MIDYADLCEEDGTCDIDRNFAFTSLDLTGVDINIDNFGAVGVNSSDVYCCQSGRNCADGYSGCEPNCIACCDVDDCTSSIRVFSESRVFLCSGDRCNNYYIRVPDLYNGNNDYSYVTLNTLDWANTVYTCGDLKALRTSNWNWTSDTCQRDRFNAGTYDDNDFPCMLRLVNTDWPVSSCPNECS